MSNRRFTIWSDAYFNAKGHGMSEAEAERHAAAKVAIFDNHRARQLREAAQRAPDPEGAPLIHSDYL